MDLLEEFLHHARQAPMKPSRLDGDHLYPFFHQGARVLGELGIELKLVDHIPFIYPVLGQYQPQTRQVFIRTRGRTVNEMSYTLAHELGHVFDVPPFPKNRSPIQPRDEAVAEMTAWLVLRELEPKVSWHATDHVRRLAWLSDFQGIVKLWLPRAIDVSHRLVDALADPQQAMELVETGGYHEPGAAAEP